MEKKNVNKLIFAIVAVAVVVAAIGGATFAYWQWVSAENTTVNVTVAQTIQMTITPESTTLISAGNNADSPTNQSLRPTDPSKYPIENAGTITNDAVMRSYAQIKIENQTGIIARPKFKLKLKITKKDGTDITDSYADQIHYAVAEGGQITLPTTMSKPIHNLRSNTWGGSWTAEGDCDTPIATGVFSKTEATTIGETGWNNSPYITNVGTESPIPFPKLTADDAASVSFEAEPYAITYHRYKVCIWLDKDYTHTNIGTTVSDPMQEAIVSLSWSDNSEVIQVTN